MKNPKFGTLKTNNALIDTPKHQGRRNRLIQLLQKKGIEDENVLNSMNRIPRHFFMDSALEEHAYEDKAFPIGGNQTISQPYTVAFQTQLLEVQLGNKVLEIGTGCGYQTAVLVEMGAEVYSIERIKTLYEFSKKMLTKLLLKPKYQTLGDGYKGLPTFAPFDKIIVTAGAPHIPEALKTQLRIGGNLVIPVGVGSQKMINVLKVGENDYETLDFGNFAFVPMIENTEK